MGWPTLCDVSHCEPNRSDREIVAEVERADLDLRRTREAVDQAIRDTHRAHLGLLLANTEAQRVNARREVRRARRRVELAVRCEQAAWRRHCEAWDRWDRWGRLYTAVKGRES